MALVIVAIILGAYYSIISKIILDVTSLVGILFLLFLLMLFLVFF